MANRTVARLLRNSLSRTKLLGRIGNGYGQVSRLAQGGNVADESQAVVVPRAAAGCDGRARVFEAGVLGQRPRENGREATACRKRNRRKQTEKKSGKGGFRQAKAALSLICSK